MKNYLFPHSYKKYGWVLLVSFIIIGVLKMIFNYEPAFFEGSAIPIIRNSQYFSDNNYYDEIISIALIIGSILVSFSKAEIEDEYIMKIRLESLVWSMYLNYGLILLAIMFVNGFAFLNVMLYNLFTPLIFMVIRFNWLLLRTRNGGKDEE